MRHATVTQGNHALLFCIVYPALVWGIHAAWVLSFPLVQSILPYDYWMLYALLSFIFPVLGTCMGVYWNFAYFRKTKQIGYIAGLLIWILVAIFGIAFLCDIPSGPPPAPSHSEIIP
jgi:hypothetical protein